MLLVDTSVWIEVFARPARIDLTTVAPMDEIATCLPVVQEVLAGFRDDRAFRLARGAMLALPIVESPMSQDVFLGAADLYRAARRAGITVRSSVDCVIASCALRNGLTVVHRDRDFDALARVSALDVRRV
ncbi:MAG: PIN domain-containing protein [Sandaracinus sp.]